MLIKKVYVIGALVLLSGMSIACSEEEPVNMAPTFALENVSDIMRTGVTLSGVISGDKSSIKDYGFEYSVSDEFTTSLTERVQVGTDVPENGNVSATVTGLEPNERYYYRLYAGTGATTVYSYSEYFQTVASSSPKISALSVDSIGENMARFRCTVEEVGDEYLLEYGVGYKLPNDGTYIPVPSDSIVPEAISGEANTFFVEITGLSPATTYNFRPYAKNSADKNGDTGTREGYGEVLTEETENLLSAAVQTVDIVEGNVGINSVTVKGMVKSAVGSDGVVDEVGFCYSKTNRTPDITDETVTSEFTKLGDYFSALIENLQTGTTYYIRAYAKNTVNGKTRVGYGSVCEVKTGDLVTPIIEWEEDGATITATSFSRKAEITNYDGVAIVEKGFIWSGSNAGIKLEEAREKGTILSVDLDTGDNVIAGTIDGLKMGSFYYVRAFAVYQAAGLEEVGYTNSYNFWTDGFTSPSLEYVVVDDDKITRKSAVLQGRIASEGNGTVTEKGFVLCSSANSYSPTLETKNVLHVKADENFSATVDGLEASTEYAVRSYAISTLGGEVDTTYAGCRFFWTKNIVYPTVEFRYVGTTAESLTFSLFISEEGDGEIVEKGFFWKKRPVGDSWPEFDLENGADGSLSFGSLVNDKDTLTIGGLSVSTEYRVKVYMKIKIDGDIHIYTPTWTDCYTEGFTSPYLGQVTIDDSKITRKSAVLQGRIDSKGNGTITEKGFVLCLTKKSYYPTLETENVIHVKADENFSATVNGLEANTPYAVRSYAISTLGGEVETTYAVDYSTFWTKEIVFPTVELNHIGGTIESLKYSMSILEEGEGEIVEKGFLWKKYEDNWSDFNLESGADGYLSFDDVENEKDTLTIGGLEVNTGYLVKGYIKMKVDENVHTCYYGTWHSSTNSLSLSLSSSATGTEIALTGHVYSIVDGVTEYGFCWSTDNVSASEMTGRIKASDLDDNNEFKATITDLSLNTTYYIGFYVKLGERILYGDERLEVKTQTIPTIDNNPSPDKKD